MKQIILLSLPILSFSVFSFLNEPGKISTYHADGIESVLSSSNPPAARTGAPGESNCTACHAGSTMSAEGVVSFTLSGGPEYVPGETYPMTIATVGGPKNGFQLTILDESNNQAGTLEAGAGSGITSSGGRQYIRHTSSLGAGSWTFNWTAPDTDVGNLTVYYAVNKSNNNGSDSGDEVFLGNESIPVSGSASITSVERLDQDYKVFYDRGLHQLNLNYNLITDANVVINIQDLSGRLVDFRELGKQNPGTATHQLNLDKVDKAGFYIISLFIDNTVLNRKIYIG
jgi:Leucine-rich repeat (LRR) protein